MVKSQIFGDGHLEEAVIQRIGDGAARGLEDGTLDPDGWDQEGGDGQQEDKVER